MMQWELSLMWEQHGGKPDTWGHFHFLCQLWQTAISTAEEDISHSFSYTHFISSTLHPSQITPLFFQVPKQYAILSKLDISELSMMGLTMTSNGRLITYTACPKTCFCYERSGKSEQIQNMISAFSGGCCRKLLQSFKFALHVGCLSPKLPRNFSKIELVHGVKSRKWGKQPPLMPRNNALSVWSFFLGSYQPLKLSVWIGSSLVLWYSYIGPLVSSNPC